jgi:hypothetical protein
MATTDFGSTITSKMVFPVHVSPSEMSLSATRDANSTSWVSSCGIWVLETAEFLVNYMFFKKGSSALCIGVRIWIRARCYDTTLSK